MLPGRGSKQEDKEGPFPLPVMRCQGPQNYDLQADAAINEDDQLDDTFMEGLLDFMMVMPQATSFAEGCDMLKEHVSTSSVSFTDIRHHLRRFNQMLDYFYDPCRLENYQTTGGTNPGICDR